MIEVWHPVWKKPTDGNLYVDRSHPPANVQGSPIRHYERATHPIHSPQEMYLKGITFDPKTGTSEKLYFSTTFFSQFTEGPKYCSNNHYKEPTKALYH